MNTKEISFKNTTTALTSVLPEIKLYDLTKVTFSIIEITEKQIPLYVKINWGDGESQVLENSFSKVYRIDSIIPEILYNKISSVFSKDNTHLYYPSISARYKMLSAELIVEYLNRDITKFIQPIKIISSDYFESIGDIKHVGANIVNSTNNKQFMFSIDKGGFLIETES